MATLTLQHPIDQIKAQRLTAEITTYERSYYETEICLCEDDQISLDVSLEIDLEFDPSWNQTKALGIKAFLISAYDARECEDVRLSKSERKIIEKYIQENLTIKIN